MTSMKYKKALKSLGSFTQVVNSRLEDLKKASVFMREFDNTLGRRKVGLRFSTERTVAQLDNCV